MIGIDFGLNSKAYPNLFKGRNSKAYPNASEFSKYYNNLAEIIKYMFLYFILNYHLFLLNIV